MPLAQNITSKKADELRTDRKGFGRYGPRFWARICLAALLLVSVLSNAIPLGSASGHHLCMKDCCAGKPPHEAGSCMMNACETNPLPQKEITKPDDPICDSHAAVPKHAGMLPAGMGEDKVNAQHQASVNEFDFATDDRSTANPTNTPSIESATFSKPCPPDCGSATFSSTNQNKRHDSAALSFAERPRPPSVNALPDASFLRRIKLEVLCRQSQPRAPPKISS
jgi:hypothetical protein